MKCDLQFFTLDHSIICFLACGQPYLLLLCVWNRLCFKSLFLFSLHFSVVSCPFEYGVCCVSGCYVFATDKDLIFNDEEKFFLLAFWKIIVIYIIRWPMWSYLSEEEYSVSAIDMQDWHVSKETITFKSRLCPIIVN